MMKLHYKNKSYELSLFDNYYITTTESEDYYENDIESIINSLQEGDGNRFKKEFNYDFTVTLNGVEIDCDDVLGILLNQHTTTTFPKMLNVDTNEYVDVKVDKNGLFFIYK